LHDSISRLKKKVSAAHENIAKEERQIQTAIKDAKHQVKPIIREANKRVP